MDFEDEHYVRVFTRDTKTWKKWGWEGQTVFMHLWRRLDKAGVLEDIQDPIQDVALLTGLPEEIVALGLPRLFESDTVRHINEVLVGPNYIKGQTAKRSDAVRAKESRERRRQTAMLSQIVTDRHETGPHVTPHDEPGREWSPPPNVTNCDGSVTNRDQQSQSVTNRHANPVPRHSMQSNAEQCRAMQSNDDVGPKDLTGNARDDVPTNVNNPKPPEPAPVALSEPSTSTRSPEATQAQSRGAQAAEPPASRIEINPRSHAAVLALPIEERACWLEAHKDCADWAQPQSWPEVVEAIQAFYVAAGRAVPRPRHYKQDYAVQAMVSHYAAGEPVAVVVAACRSYPKTESYRKRLVDKRAPSAAWITAEVVRRSADDVADAATIAADLARERLERETASKSASIVATVEHLNNLREPSAKDWSRPRPVPLPGRGPKALLGGRK